jgi:hypothetical protein
MCGTNCGASGVSTKLSAWFDPSDTGAITQSSNAISQWDDETGALSLTQATAGAKPTLVAAGGGTLNGTQHVSFDGGDDLRSATKVFTGSLGECFAVVDVDNTATTCESFLVECNTGANTQYADSSGGQRHGGSQAGRS